MSLAIFSSQGETQVTVFVPVQVLKDYQGTISLKELSEMTAIKVEDVVSTLQHLNLIQYQKGQHVICAAPKLIERSVVFCQTCTFVESMSSAFESASVCSNNVVRFV